MVKGYEYVRRAKSICESKRRETQEHAYTSKSYDKYLNVLSRNKTIWMFYAIFGFLSILSTIIISSIIKGTFGVALEVFTLINIIVIIALCIITRYYKKESLQRVEREKKKLYSSFDGLKNVSENLAKVSMLSYVLSHRGNDIKSAADPESELVKLTNEYTVKISNETKTSDDYSNSYSEWLIKMEK